MKTWTNRIANAVPGLIVVVALAFLALSVSGCRGGLFGGKQSPDQARGDIYVYRVQNEPGSRAITNIGNAGQVTPMYQAPEGTVETTAGGENGAFVTTPSMPASSGSNAGTAAGKYIIQTINDGVKRSAESDVSTAAQLLAGNTQTQAGQNPAQTLRQGASTSGGAVTGTNEANPAVQLNPAANLAGQGGAQQTPTSTQAGSGSQPGAVAGGTGSLTGTTPAAGTGTAATTDPYSAYELVTAATANEDGTYTVSTAKASYTGKAVTLPIEGGVIGRITTGDGVQHLIRATGANAELLCPGCQVE